MIMSEKYINSCFDKNLSFIESIPNSAAYWSDRKRDLFAMIRQLGKPTIFLTMSPNEIGWNDLLKTLHRLKSNGLQISDSEIDSLNYFEKTTLVNEDAVACAVYFNKLVNTIITRLQFKTFSPFGKHRVLNYFKRIEFQHKGSPHAHILLWLNNATTDPLGADYNAAITFINSLISVSAKQASGHIKLQTHIYM